MRILTIGGAALIAANLPDRRVACGDSVEVSNLDEASSARASAGVGSTFHMAVVRAVRRSIRGAIRIHHTNATGRPKLLGAARGQSDHVVEMMEKQAGCETSLKHREPKAGESRLPIQTPQRSRALLSGGTATPLAEGIRASLNGSVLSTRWRRRPVPTDLHRTHGDVIQAVHTIRTGRADSIVWCRVQEHWQ